MNHGKVSKEIARGLKILRKRIGKEKIPSSKLDESINLATWNIRDFGKSEREPASIHYIAEIMWQFDLIAVAEVRDNISDLKRVLDILGPYWRVVFSDFITDHRGNRERFAYVYDKRAVTFTGLASEADEPRKLNKKTKEFEPSMTWYRKPYMASFSAGNFDFIIVGVHIRWGKGKKARIKPLKMLAEWIEERRTDKHVIDKDIMVVGDFNIPKINDALYKAITSKGLRMADALLGEHGSNLKKNARYDQILHYPNTKCFTKKAGVLDFHKGSFKPLYPWSEKTENRLSWEVSDHLPLWVQLDVDSYDEQLDQIIRSKKK
ncbi:MAG: endonuclease/exonuclease/phosphatase family protein [candidate division Zixibacteria bacterium]